MPKIVFYKASELMYLRFRRFQVERPRNDEKGGSASCF